MKFFTLLTFICLSLASGFDIPKGTHHLGELDQAIEDAAKAKQPVAFIITEKKGVATWVSCIATVSLSASKAVLPFTQNVIVDVSETAGLPDLVKDAYRKGGASIPLVIFADPGMTTIYGSYNHPQLKTQKYDVIFKDAKTSIKKALKEGSFDLGASAPKVTKTTDAKIENWTSSKGTPIKAKLIGIEGEKTFLFETEAGKTIRATAAQLSPESVEKAKEMVKDAS